MKWKLLLSLFIVLIVSRITVSDFTSDLEKVTYVYNCDPYCTFNHSEITSKTKEFFPIDCYTVCGILTINENTDLSESQIRKLFEKMYTLFGGIKLESTQFQGFSVFTKDPTVNKFDFMCKTFGLSVVNNTHLTDIDFLKEFYFGKDKKTDECPILFENNPKLDVSSLCDNEDYKEMFQLKITGNLKNCGKISAKYNRKELYDLFRGPFIINLENLHPDFCLTAFEIVFFLENYISFKNIHGSICPGIEKTLIDGYPICEFKSMKLLKDDCLFIHGNVIVGSGDEEYLYKLKGLQFVFGTLTVKNTKLNDLKSLWSLNYIASLEEEYVIEIISNQNLINADLPNLRNIITKGSRTIVLDDNPVLVSEGCMLYSITYQTNVAFIGDNCGNASTETVQFFLVILFIFCVPF